MIKYFKWFNCQCHVADQANLWIEGNVSVSIDLSSPVYKDVAAFFRKAAKTNEHLGLDPLGGRQDFSMFLEEVDEGGRNWIVFSGEMSLVLRMPQKELNNFADWLEAEYEAEDD